VRGWSAQLVGPRRLRIGMDAGDESAVENVVDRMVAVTAADVPTLDSVQIKGRVVDIEPPCAVDLEVVHQQSEAFLTAVHQVDGHPLELLRRLLPTRLVMLEIEISEVFDQSPGPRAGARMEGAQ
jgi:hypothetical protein